MTGTIINLRATDTKVPTVLASIIGADEQVIDKVLIAPPIARLKAEGQTTFDVVYPKVPEGAQNVTFAFSFLSVKPSSEKKEAAHEDEAEESKHDEPAHEAPAAPEHGEAEHAPPAH